MQNWEENRVYIELYGNFHFACICSTQYAYGLIVSTLILLCVRSFFLSYSLFLSLNSTIGSMPILNCDFNTHHKHITIITRLTEILLLLIAQTYFAFHDGENLFEHCVYVRIVLDFFSALQLSERGENQMCVTGK